MQVLDTDAIPAADRADAFQATVSQNCSSSVATFEDSASLRAQMHVFDLGVAKVFTIDASGTTLRRTPRIARQVTEHSIALALPLRTDNRFVWEREDRYFGPRDLILVDLSTPYVYGWRGEGASYAFHVDADDLGLPIDTVRAATRRLPGSPIYRLVRDHIAHVTTQAQALADGPAAAHVGAASAELMRALVVSATDDGRRADEALQTSLAARVQAYVRLHLRDPELKPARIAAANHLSLRALYKLYESIGVSLEQSIIEQRLIGARADLAATGRGSIAAVARAWGFANPSFFASRFREQYGVTPRQWRASRTAPD